MAFWVGRRGAIPAGVAGLALAGLAQGGAARAAPAMEMRLAGPLAPPAGFLAWCRRAPAECGVLPGAVDRLEAVRLQAILAARFEAPEAQPLPRPELTRALWKEILRINTEVNVRLRPVREAEDEWSMPLQDGRGTGDCEDYVLEKRHALAAAGLPPQALSIAVVVTPRDETHAVLLVETSADILVLDNLTPVVRRWNDTPYRWTMRQAPGRPLDWRAIG